MGEGLYQSASAARTGEVVHLALFLKNDLSGSLLETHSDSVSLVLQLLGWLFETQLLQS